MTLFDDLPDTPEDARNDGFAVVVENAGHWWDNALAAVQRLTALGWQGTGEDLRNRLEPAIGPPHSPNAWGALVYHCVRIGYLTRTGERRRMKSLRSHARSTDVYQTASKRDHR